MINVSDLSKIYNESSDDEFEVFKGLNFNVKSGEIFAIKGGSGAGKSTVLSLLAGFDKPNFGKIEILGTTTTALSIKFMSEFRRKNIGFIFQNFNLLGTLSVLENVLLPTLPLGAKKYENRAYELLEKFSLFSKKGELAKNLSGGEKQRVAIARALIMNPSIILADEPTANLDAKLSQDFVEILKELRSDGKSIVVATHDPLIAENSIISSFIELGKC